MSIPTPRSRQQLRVSRPACWRQVGHDLRHISEQFARQRQARLKEDQQSRPAPGTTCNLILIWLTRLLAYLAAIHFHAASSI